MRMKRVTKYCQKQLPSNPSLIKAELVSINSEIVATDSGLTAWQCAVLTSRLDDYKKFLNKVKTGIRLLPNLAADYKKLNPVEFDGIKGVAKKQSPRIR